MAGRGRPPKDGRVNKSELVRGDVQTAETAGWRHGDVPAPPDGLMQASIDTWNDWFAAWFALFWIPADVRALRQTIRLYDQVERGRFQRHPELRLMMDTYGVTPKGQQDRRWRPPVEPAPASPSRGTYEHLRAAMGSAPERARGVC